MSVSCYKTLSITKKPYATTLYALTNKPVAIRTQYLDALTGEKLEDTDIETFIKSYESLHHLYPTDPTISFNLSQLYLKNQNFS